MTLVLFLIDKAISIYALLIVVRALLSWVPDLAYRHPEFVRLLERITDPAIRPFRKLLSPYKTGGLDLSPLLAIVALSILRGIVHQVFLTVLR